jgi:predicted porin
MQKKIIALAIASALTVPAMAFADTTIYGVLDAGYAQTKSDNGAGITRETDAFGFSTMTSSRLGFMTTEDLGGGTKVMAKIETGLSGNVMANYTQASTADGTSVDTTSLGNRELNASVMFAQGTTVKLGYGSTLIRDFSLGYAPDPGGNLIGNILNNNKDYSSNRVNGLTVTQAMDKFSVSFQLSAHTNKANGAADLKSGNGYLIGGQYADGPISVGAAYQDLETTTNSTLGVQTADAKKKIAILAGSYDLGVAKILAEYGTDKTDDSVSAAANNQKHNGLSIGAQAPFGAFLGFVQLSKGKVNAGGTGTADQNQSGYTLGGKYNMSKASYGYLSFGENKTDAGSGGAPAQNKVDQFAIGMVHTF